MKPKVVCAISVAFLMTVASCSYSGEPVTSAESVLRFFPDDTYGMLFVDVAGLRENALVNEWIREQSGSRIPGSLNGFADRTGLHFGTNVEQIALGTSGPGELLAVVRADYDSERAVSYFDDTDFPVETHGDRRIYQTDPAQNWRVSFIEDYVLMGPDRSVRGAIDRMEDPDSTAMDNLDLVEGLRSIRDGYHVWAVGTSNPGLLPGGFETPQMVTDVFNSLERGTYQMRLDEIVTGRAVGEFASPEVALRTSNLFQGLVTLGRIQAARFPGLRELLDGLEIETVESAVHVNFEVDAEALGRLGGSGVGFGN